MSLGLIFLSGGIGSRLGADIPKQYLMVEGKVLFSYSLEELLTTSLFAQVVIVCDESYRDLFLPYVKKYPLVFALPGKRRQDSVENGFKLLDTSVNEVVIHDAARPLVVQKDILRLITKGRAIGAAALGISMTSTVKEVNKEGVVKQTLPRDHLKLIQTPQYIRYDWLEKGLAYAHQHNVEVTDDIAFAEILGYPNIVVEGSEDNIKLTTSFDLICLEMLLKQRSSLYG